MITVCIFTLRDAMRTVQAAFKITKYGTKHTVPNMSEEVQIVADALAREELQTCKPNRPANKFAKPVHDMLYEGSRYPNTPKAFRNFRKDSRAGENLGVLDEEGEGDDMEIDDDDENQDEEEDAQDEDDVADEDLGVDDDEFFEFGTSIFQNAVDMVGDDGVIAD
jgi:hypothetical protein